MFINRFRLQEANPNPSGGGGNPDWRTSFGAEGQTVLKDFKEPTDFLKTFNDRSTELTTLKGQQPTFDFRKELVDEKVLGPDAEKASKFLGRFNDKGAFIKSVLEAQSKLGERDAHKPLAKDAKPEEIAAYRAQNGIPAEPKGYWEKLPDGLVIGKEDQPVFDAYGALAHKHNVAPAVMHDFAKAYYDGVEQMKVEEAKVDRADAQKAVTELRAKMGPDYDANKAILDNWIEGMPADLQPLFKDATLGDGTRLFNSAAALEFLMDAARKLNPAAHLIPAGGEANMMGVETELNSIKGLMADKNSKYWKGPESEKLQKRYRDLVTAQSQLKR